MNTGVHDAINIAWKLACVLKKWYHHSVLSTYDTEHRPVAEKVIQLDRTISALISGTLPPELAAASSDPTFTVYKVLDENIKVTTGRGISGLPNLLNVPTKSGMLRCGCRAPDVLVYAPGASSRLPTKLQSVMKIVGAFRVVMFAGEPFLTQSRLMLFRRYIDNLATAN